MTTNRSLLISVQQYQKTHDKAVQLHGLFEDAEPSELLRVQQELDEEAKKLVEETGLDWSQCGSLGRHLNFLSYYLKRNDKESCALDIKDIVFFDLPATLKALIALSSDDQHFDQRLKDAVFPLLDGGHLDSAIRKAFIVLTDRLRRAFGVKADVDGEDLVNQVFGKGGKISVALDEPRKQAFRNLISGFYGVYRNKYAHNDSEANVADARAIVEMTNQIILEIEQVANASAKAVASLRKAGTSNRRKPYSKARRTEP